MRGRRRGVFAAYRNETSSVPFQVAIPTNGADRAFVRYRDVTGQDMDGRHASVGFQTFDGRTRASWCHRERGRIRDGLALQFLFGVGTNPLLADTDGDGVSDGDEVRSGSDPNDASDGGRAPPADSLRELTFDITGDFAAWEMTIKGLGPVDRRTLRITMGGPNRPEDVPKKLRKGNSYRLTMKWLNSDGHTGPPCWYCWQAKIDGQPSGQTFAVGSSGFATRNGLYHVLAGSGWVAENESGVLSAHTHTHDYSGGNIADGLSATLHVLDVDVEIDGVGENAEETRGAYAPWVPEHVEQGEADWTDSLVPVKVTCRPEGLPTNATVRIVADDLLRRTADGYAAVRSGAEFPAGSVKDESFYLCARTASAAPRDKSVTATCCGVFDEAKYTAYACYFIAYVDQPGDGSRGKVWVRQGLWADVGHAFWEMRCRPVPESVEGISNSDFLNKRVGFYGDGFHVPDTDHQPEVVKMVPISKAKFLSGLGFCERFRTSTPQYNLSTYNCCNATIDAAAACGVWIKRTPEKWPLGGGLNPHALGEDLMQNNWRYGNNLHERNMK